MVTIAHADRTCADYLNAEAAARQNRLPDSPDLSLPPVVLDNPYPASPEDFVGPVEAAAGGVGSLQGFFPYASLIPTDPEGNRRFRKHVREVWTRDHHRAKLIEICRRDPLFWLHGFVNIRRDKADFQQRGTRDFVREIPFLLWERQVWALGQILEARLQGEDVLGEKPREIGLTWLCETPFVHDFVLGRDATHMMFANKAENVDGAKPNSLLKKFNYLVSSLPEWMVCKEYRENKGRKFNHDMYRHNPETNVTIVGESTTTDVGRMDRYQDVLLDEAGAIDGAKLDSILAGTTGIAWTRIIISTPPEAGEWHPFSRLRKTSIRKITLTWKDDPRKVEGLYIAPDGSERSPWMDYEESRAGMSKRGFAREYLLDYGGVSGQYFPPELLARIKEQTVELPKFVGEFDFASENEPEFCRVINLRPCDNGRLKLWFFPEDGKAPRGRFGIAVDPAAGSADSSGRGASNSACGVVDLDTGEKILEYKVHGIQAHKFAIAVAAIYRWFEATNRTGPETVWENNGHGNAGFGRTLIEDCKVTQYWTDELKPSRTPGWMTTGGKGGNRGIMFADLSAALDRGTYTERSFDCLMEMGEYDHATDDSGGAIHKGSRVTKDLSEARANHGDLVIMTTLLVQLIRRFGNKKRNKGSVSAPFLSQAWFEQRENEPALY